MTNVETFYFTFFLTKLAMFSMELTAVIGTIYSTVDACLSWIYGGILNAIKPRKWGRYRSWLIMVPWIVPFLFAFQFLKVSENTTVSAVVITAAAIISHIVWNFPYAANAAIVSFASKDPQDRAILSSSRATWNNIAGVAFSYVGLPLANVLANVVGEINKFAALAFVLGVLMAVGYYVHFRITDGYEELEDPNAAKPSNRKASVKDLAKALFQNPQLILLIIADLAKWVIKFVVAASAIYYWTYVANNAGMQATYVLAANLAAVVGAYGARWFTKYLSNRATIISAYILMAAAMYIAYFAYSKVTLVFVLMVIAQFGYGVCYACAPALYADTAVYAEWKTGKNSAGWIMGLQTLPLKVAVMVRAGIVAACLKAANFDASIDPSAATPELQRGITAAFALWPAVFVTAGALILIFGYRLTKEKVAKYQAEIDARV
jgi:Na+/melibiose symporter-like transporter